MNGLGGGGQYSEDDFELDYKLPLASTSYYQPTLNLSTGSHQGSSGVQGFTFPTAIPGGSIISSRTQICCLIDDGKRCARGAGNASYSKRIQKTVYYKRLKLEIDMNANHIYICDHHKMIIQTARSRQKKDSEDEGEVDAEPPDVDLYQLQLNTLRRYKKHFKIPSRPGLNKAQLADIITRHFKTIPVMEKETVTYFIYMIKSEKNKLDNSSRVDTGNGSEFADRY